MCNRITSLLYENAGNALCGPVYFTRSSSVDVCPPTHRLVYCLSHPVLRLTVHWLPSVDLQYAVR